MKLFAVLKAQSLLFWLLLASPLLYLPNLEGRARLLRFLCLVIVLIGSVAEMTFSKNITLKKTFRPVKIALGLIAAMMIITWVVNIRSNDRVYYIGTTPEYVGYFSWVLIIFVGLRFRYFAEKILSDIKVIYIFLIILIVSLLYGSYYIEHSLQIGGVLYSNISIAVYANIALAVSIHQLTKHQEMSKKTVAAITILLSLLTVIVSQSLLGFLVMLVSLTIWSVYRSDLSLKLRFILVFFTFLIALLPSVNSNYFMELNNQGLAAGLSDKANVYKTYYPTLIKANFFYGNGPASLPLEVDNQNRVPGDILKNLNIKTDFSTINDLFFDFSYYFGVLAAIILLSLSIYALRNYYVNRTQYSLGYFLVFSILVLNCLFNSPSIELTPLYFIFLFAGCFQDDK